jgi:hypothetical protein
MRPTFSMAPKPTDCGITSASSFSKGYGRPKCCSSSSRIPGRHHARVARLRAAALRRDVAKRCVVHARGAAVHDVERAHRERDEVARKRLRRREVMSLPALALQDVRSEDFGRVAHGLDLRGRVDRDTHGVLYPGSSKHGTARRGDGLELRHHVPVASLLLAEGPRVETGSRGPR